MPFRTPIRYLIGAALCSAMMPLAAQAEEPWPFVSLDVYRYDSLINTHRDVGLPCCFPHVVGNPGEMLIHISAVIDVPWSDELDRVSIGPRDLTLTIPGEEEPRTQAGHFSRTGLYEALTTSISASRPRDYPETDESLWMNIVWSVPEDTTTATLTLGEYFSIEVEMPEEVSEPMTPGDTADFAITAITPVEDLESSVGFSGHSLAGYLDLLAGQIVRVDFEVVIQMSTSLRDRPSFAMDTRLIQLVGPNGLPAVPVGQYLVDGIMISTSNSFTGDIVGGTRERSFYYLTDGTPGTYTLYFGSDPVAEGTL